MNPEHFGIQEIKDADGSEYLRWDDTLSDGKAEYVLKKATEGCRFSVGSTAKAGHLSEMAQKLGRADLKFFADDGDEIGH